LPLSGRDHGLAFVEDLQLAIELLTNFLKEKHKVIICDFHIKFGTESTPR